MNIIEQLQKIQPKQVIAYIKAAPNSVGHYAVKSAAYDLYKADKAFLVQRKNHDTGLFDYLAIGKVEPPCPKRVKGRTFYVEILERKVL